MLLLTRVGFLFSQSRGKSRELPPSASENPAEQNPQTSHHAGCCRPWVFPSFCRVGRQSVWRLPLTVCQEGLRHLSPVASGQPGLPSTEGALL